MVEVDEMARNLHQAIALNQALQQPPRASGERWSRRRCDDTGGCWLRLRYVMNQVHRRHAEQRDIGPQSDNIVDARGHIVERGARNTEVVRLGFPATGTTEF